jgi:hypothetical protein
MQPARRAAESWQPRFRACGSSWKATSLVYEAKLLRCEVNIIHVKNAQNVLPWDKDFDTRKFEFLIRSALSEHLNPVGSFFNI